MEDPGRHKEAKYKDFVIIRSRKSNSASMQIKQTDLKSQSNPFLTTGSQAKSLQFNLIEKQNHTTNSMIYFYNHCIDSVSNQEPFLANPEPLKQEPSMSFTHGLIAYVKVNVVCGFLYLPMAYKNGGWLFSTVTMLTVAILTMYCNICVSNCSSEVKSYTFAGVTECIVGKRAAFLIDLIMAASQVGFTVGVINVITQVLTVNVNSLCNTPVPDLNIYITIGLFVLLAPPCLVRNMTKFNFMLLVGDVVLATSLFFLCFFALEEILANPNFNIQGLELVSQNWAKFIGVSMVCFEGVGVILPLKQSIEDQSRYDGIIIVGSLIIAGIFTVFPILMLFCYQADTKEVILMNLPMEVPMIKVLCVLLIISVLIAYPLILFPAFSTIERLFLRGYSAGLRLLTVLVSILVGVNSINNFDNVLSLLGSLIYLPLAFIIPTLVHFVLFRDKQTKARNFLDLSLTALSSLLSVVILIETVRKW